VQGDPVGDKAFGEMFEDSGYTDKCERVIKCDAFGLGIELIHEGP
jgi:hypothetical protein